MEAHDICENTLLPVWKMKFDTGKIDALKESKTWRHFTKEQKIAGVRDYLRAENLLLKKIEEIDWIG